MDYSQVCQGWIYTITNKINGKMYVGKTSNFERRKHDHFSKKEHSTVLKRAYDKYGIENFEMVPILTFRAINPKVLNKIMNWLEKYYIAKYNSYKNGYNATIGGDGHSGFIPSEETKNKTKQSLMGHAVSEDTKDKIRQWCITHQTGGRNKRTILQYSLEGNFIREWESRKAVCEFLYGKRESKAIDEALKYPSRHASGFLWRYKECEQFPTQIEPYKNPCIKMVYHYDINGNFIECYESAAKAHRITKQSLSRIYQSVYSRKKGKVPTTDYWSLESPK